jgi:AAA15 family ATPase/GTPase
MRLIKFRIQNFKSIIDTGYCSFASDLTILIGKNESGKTATLEALRYFNKSIQRVSENAFPLEGNNKEPMVEIFFRLSPEEITEIQNVSGVKFSQEAVEYLLENGLSITKNCRGNYRLGSECTEKLFSRGEGVNPLQVVQNIKSAKDKLQEILNSPQIPTIDFESSKETVQREIKELIKVVKPFLPSLKNEQLQAEALDAVRVIIKESGRLGAVPTRAEHVSQEKDEYSDVLLLEALVDRVPNFIFFSEFSNTLPFEISISQLKENQAVVDFAAIAGLDIDLLMETQDIQRRINYLNRHSAIVSADFLDYWGQNQIELMVKPEGDKLLFGVKEKDQTDIFKVSQRSKGFQWFLSFYLRLNAEKAKHNAILIDEPGMYLHAKAQKEILKVLEQKVVTESQVIFSTHCPYLIDTQRLDRVRLVLKKMGCGTTISEDIENCADEESLMPVLTAMGGEKVDTVPLLGKKNIIVENMADFYVWKALKESIKELDSEEINFLPATDPEHMAQIVSLLIGYDSKFQILLNNNAAGRQMEQKLKERFGLEDRNIVFASETQGDATEDLFTSADFYLNFLGQERDESQAVSNSEYLKAHNINKVLLARKFYNTMKKRNGQIVLTHRTVSAFRDVFDKIIAGFNPLPERLVDFDVRKASEDVVEPIREEVAKRRSLFDILKQK